MNKKYPPPSSTTSHQVGGGGGGGGGGGVVNGGGGGSQLAASDGLGGSDSGSSSSVCLATIQEPSGSSNAVYYSAESMDADHRGREVNYNAFKVAVNIPSYLFGGKMCILLY